MPPPPPQVEVDENGLVEITSNFYNQYLESKLRKMPAIKERYDQAGPWKISPTIDQSSFNPANQEPRHNRASFIGIISMENGRPNGFGFT